MYKDFTKFITESTKENIFYTTAESMSLDEFIEIEVEERENYEMEEIEEWIDKYSLTRNSRLLWVTRIPAIAARYQMDADLWNDDLYIEEYNKDPESWYVQEVLGSEGVIITESDDGDEGFLMVLNSKKWND